MEGRGSVGGMAHRTKTGGYASQGRLDTGLLQWRTHIWGHMGTHFPSRWDVAKDEILGGFTPNWCVPRPRKTSVTLVRRGVCDPFLTTDNTGWGCGVVSGQVGTRQGARTQGGAPREGMSKLNKLFQQVWQLCFQPERWLCHGRNSWSVPTGWRGLKTRVSLPCGLALTLKAAQPQTRARSL